MSDRRNAEPAIVTHHREQLAYLLTEAAEIEHGLMCCYLFAAYSLKRGVEDGLSKEDTAQVARWRGALVEVAIDEMLHLALVSNLLTAIGSAPHFQRPNFPVSPGYHPAGVVVELAPFSVATMNHFVYLERPEGVDVPDGEGFEAVAPYERVLEEGRLVPSAQDYATVGHLYRGIRAGLENLAGTLGEAGLFVGDPAAQVGPDLAALDGLVAVVDLASALRAVDTIVEQGEGSPANPERSHYRRFVAVRDELRAALAARPAFAPAHAVARNPVMRKPPVPKGKVHIDAPETALVLDFGNAVYSFALRCLARAFGESEDPMAARRALVEGSFTAMRDLAPVMQLLARLPATRAGAAAGTAGLTFTMQRSTVGFSQQQAAWSVLAERASEIAAVAAGLAARLDPVLARVGEDFGALAQTLERVRPKRTLPVVEPASSTSTSGIATSAPAPAPAIEQAEADGVTLRFETKRCIHARHCVLGAPEVFLANVQGPWLHPEATTPERIAEVAHACPSGAITYLRKDGGAPESAPKVNVSRIRENGPLAIHADVELEGHGALFRATLCRCGASKNKPFCDGSHQAAGFVASGEPETRPSEPLAARSGVLRVVPMRDGPLAVTGSLEICSGTGRTVDRVTSCRLCRCGGSAKKPFCDGTHARNGFRSEQG
jgi:CDGSH-type Zn-finger protein/uncharacterized Fe-S cluster protein YjdI